MSGLPFLFIQQMEKKHAIHLKGERPLILLLPRFKVKKASFVWENRVELVEGDFEIEINPLAWIRSQIWSIKLEGDGAVIRFLGDWKRKTGVSEIKADRLRLALDFDHGDIHEIHHVEVMSPEYQLQIKTREISG